MKKFGKIISGILASLSMHGVAPSIPVLSGSVASASAVANKSDVYDKWQEILRKVSDQKGYDNEGGIEDAGDRVYICCKNGNKVKVSKEDFVSIRRYFHMSFCDLLGIYDCEKGIMVKASNQSDVSDKFGDICRKISDQKGYDSEREIYYAGGRVYICCKNGNKVKVSKEDFVLIQGYFHMSFCDLLESYDYEKGVIVRDARRSYSEVLRKFDNTSIGSIFPVDTRWADKGLITISNLAELILSKCSSCKPKEKECGKRRLSRILSNSDYAYYENNITSYDFGALASVICDYAEGWEKWCEKLCQLKDEGIPLDRVASGLLDKRLGKDKGNTFTCVRNLVVLVLNSFAEV